MFIERSTAKIRSVRALFVALGLVPCAGLVAWALLRHSPAHCDAIRHEAEQVLGMPLAVGAVEHIRPGALRLRDCVLAAPDGRSLLTLPEIEVETSADEVRLRLPKISCSPAVAAALAGVARSWLEEPVRFSKAWVIDVGSMAWDRPHGELDRHHAVASAGDGSFPLRIECVAVGDSRAVRVHRVDRRKESDEVRVIATTGSPRRHELRGRVHTPIPWSVLQALVPPVFGSTNLGPGAMVSGEVEASTAGGDWSGVATGLVEGGRLEDVAVGTRYQIEGPLAIEVERLEWDADRLVALAATMSAVRGTVAQSLLGALVTTCGCRAGPAFQSLAGEPLRAFDDLAVRVAIDSRGLRLSAAENRSGALARRQGLSLLDEPAGAVSLDRLAWLIGPADAPAVPASPTTSWLMRTLPAATTSPRRRESTAIPLPDQSRRQADF
jgi:hypothetical protein